MDRQEARAGFNVRGETIREWAKQRNFDAGVVYGVLAGRILGVRGQAHRVAVALGIKQVSPTADAANE